MAIYLASRAFGPVLAGYPPQLGPPRHRVGGGLELKTRTRGGHYWVSPTPEFGAGAGNGGGADFLG